MCVCMKERKEQNSENSHLRTSNRKKDTSRNMICKRENTHKQVILRKNVSMFSMYKITLRFSHKVLLLL